MTEHDSDHTLPPGTARIALGEVGTGAALTPAAFSARARAPGRAAAAASAAVPSSRRRLPDPLARPDDDRAGLFPTTGGLGALLALDEAVVAAHARVRAVLARLADGTLTAGEFHERCLHGRNGSYALHQMQAAGLLEILPSRDRRTKLVRLTAAGAALVARLQAELGA